MSNYANVIGSGRTWLRGAIGLAIGAFFLWLVFRQTSWEKVETILSQAEIGWLLAAIGLYATNMFFRVVRWRILLSDIKALSFRSVGTALIIGYAMNNILPARLGELFRANFAGRRYQISRAAIAGSIVVERVMDGLIVVLSLLLGRLFVGEQALLTSLTIFGGTLFSSIFIVLWFSSRQSQRNWSIRLPVAITRRIQGFQQGLTGMRGTRFIQAASLSLLVWLLEGTAHWSILKSIGMSLSWQQMLSVVGVVNLSTLMPSAPGFVGTYQYAYAFTVSLFGYQSAQGVAAATAAQIFLLGSLTLVGLGLYGYLQFDRSDRKTN
jgi:glycosyltransferase 2 family protein